VRIIVSVSIASQQNFPAPSEKNNNKKQNKNRNGLLPTKDGRSENGLALCGEKKKHVLPAGAVHTFGSWRPLLLLRWR